VDRVEGTLGMLAAIVAVALLLDGEEGLASGRSQADAGKRNFLVV
jgi:hypothetical protein